jgi:hypothetical protein
MCSVGSGFAGRGGGTGAPLRGDGTQGFKIPLGGGGGGGGRGLFTCGGGRGLCTFGGSGLSGLGKGGR